MSTIISGFFQTQDEVQFAISELQRVGFTLDAISAFYVNPAGQHDLYPDGGDEQQGGVDTVPVRKAGMLVAVAVVTALQEDEALALLQSINADAIERSTGTIVDGDWSDFDPLSEPHLVTRVGPAV